MSQITNHGIMIGNVVVTEVVKQDEFQNHIAIVMRQVLNPNTLIFQKVLKIFRTNGAW